MKQSVVIQELQLAKASALAAAVREFESDDSWKAAGRLWMDGELFEHCQLPEHGPIARYFLGRVLLIWLGGNTVGSHFLDCGSFEQLWRRYVYPPADFSRLVEEFIDRKGSPRWVEEDYRLFDLGDQSMASATVSSPPLGIEVEFDNIETCEFRSYPTRNHQMVFDWLDRLQQLLIAMAEMELIPWVHGNSLHLNFGLTAGPNLCGVPNSRQYLTLLGLANIGPGRLNYLSTRNDDDVFGSRLCILDNDCIVSRLGQHGQSSACYVGRLQLRVPEIGPLTDLGYLRHCVRLAEQTIRNESEDWINRRLATLLELFRANQIPRLINILPCWSLKGAYAQEVSNWDWETYYRRFAALRDDIVCYLDPST